MNLDCKEPVPQCRGPCPCTCFSWPSCLGWRRALALICSPGPYACWSGIWHALCPGQRGCLWILGSWSGCLGLGLSSSSGACKCSNLGLLGRNGGSIGKRQRERERIERCGELEEIIRVGVGLTLVEKEFDMTSLTVPTTLTFSAAYVPGPID